MGNITLRKEYVSGVTSVFNRFIDEFMFDANDAQIKIYLYLLRCFEGNVEFSTSSIADRFNYTEKDVIRALKFWDERQVLSLSCTSTGKITGVTINDLSVTKAGAFDEEVSEDYDAQVLPVSRSRRKKKDVDVKPKEDVDFSETYLKEEPEELKVPGKILEKSKDVVKVVDFNKKPKYSAAEIERVMNRPDMSDLAFVVEAYLGKTLRKDELATIVFMHEECRFNSELIEYLFEYCADNDIKKISLIENVARVWFATGISTAEEAKIRTGRPTREVYTVLNAFGISGRNPIEPEISYVYKWVNIYKFDIDIIKEACNRTIMQIHTASFEYADTVLYNWKENNVTSFDDIKELDRKHSKEVNFKERKKDDISYKKPINAAAVNSPFNSFKQHDYDYEALAREMSSK